METITERSLKNNLDEGVLPLTLMDQDFFDTTILRRFVTDPLFSEKLLGLVKEAYSKSTDIVNPASIAVLKLILDALTPAEVLALQNLLENLTDRPATLYQQISNLVKLSHLNLNLCIQTLKDVLLEKNPPVAIVNHVQNSVQEITCCVQVNAEEHKVFESIKIENTKISINTPEQVNKDAENAIKVLKEAEAKKKSC